MVPTAENVSVRLEKFDKEYRYPSDDDPFAKLAYKYTVRHLSYIEAQPKREVDSLIFKGESSSGLLGKMVGLPKTREYIRSNTFNKYKDDLDHIPISCVNTKDEFLSPEDLARKKIRFVDVVPKEQIYKQKILFDNQNDKMKARANKLDSWIKYGFVKQSGGFDELCTHFEDCSILSFSDISGYDTSACLRKVYELRGTLLDLSPEEFTPEEITYFLELFEYTVYFTVRTVTLMPDGTIRLFLFRNPSGQNNTASDNSILHEMIVFDEIITLWFNAFGVMPTYQECLDSVKVGLYSDDKAIGFCGKLQPDTKTLSETEIAVYAKYGMIIKQSASKIVQHQPNTRFADGEFEFLGSYCHWDEAEDFYFTTPRVDKLCTSLVKTLVITRDILSLAEQYQKIYQICGLLWSTDVYPAVSEYLDFFKTTHADVLDFDDLERAMDVLPDEPIISLFTGREAGLEQFFG